MAAGLGLMGTRKLGLLWSSHPTGGHTGSVSYVEGLKVGAAIEELDMVDINTALLQVDNQDIRLVYDNLLKGSRNHLRSYVNTLANLGVTYVPRYMAPADYTAIVTTAIER